MQTESEELIRSQRAQIDRLNAKVSRLNKENEALLKMVRHLRLCIVVAAASPACVVTEVGSPPVSCLPSATF
jgi:hypothetical protein